jgi:CRP-like cAMP-binding protein
MSDATEQLRRVPLFAGLTDRSFDAVSDLAQEQELPQGHVLAAEGEPGDAFYLLLDGQVRISRNGAAVRDLQPGEFLGEIALVDGRARTATATATTPVRVATIGCAAFGDLMERFPAVRHGILVALADRVRHDEAGSVD